MIRQISVKRYRRSFRHPLRTAHGNWMNREGFLVRVEQAGVVGYGEVAPLPEFGTESVSDAASFLEELVQAPTLQIPSHMPCCQFAISAAGRAAAPVKDYPIAALLPAGSAGQRVAVNKIEQGYTYLKWKIGVEPTAKEQVEAVSLLDSLPKAVALRLDANASLSIEDLDSWLQLLADYREQVDYLEQPLAVGEEVAMASRMMDTGIAIALDESLNGQDGARWLEAGEWAGPLVIKAPLIGNVETLRQKLDPVAEQVVLSSVFETGVGLLNTLSLADALGATLQPIGFDTLDAFDDKLMPLESAPFIGAPERSTYTAEQIWNLI